MKAGAQKMRGALPLLAAVVVLTFGACVLHHRIEPSDKPLVVNLNVKIDHEIRVKIKEQNQDILNLEDEYLKKKSGTKGEG